MKRLRFLVFLLPAIAILCGVTGPALAAVLIVVDKPSQTMTVAVNGAVQYRWYVSTGATGYSTPGGTYTPFRMERMHYSQEWDNAGMPNSIFFSTRGHAIHGSDHPGRGSPVSRASLAAERGDSLSACLGGRHGQHEGRDQRVRPSGLPCRDRDPDAQAGAARTLAEAVHLFPVLRTLPARWSPLDVNHCVTAIIVAQGL
jgi:L,D-transpeptidase-like protein